MKLGIKRIGVVVATASLAVSGVATIAATGASAAKKPVHLKTYEIGYQGPLSGGNQATGLYEKYGAQLAVKQWTPTKSVSSISSSFPVTTRVTQQSPLLLQLVSF